MKKKKSNRKGSAESTMGVALTTQHKKIRRLAKSLGRCLVLHVGADKALEEIGDAVADELRGKGRVVDARPGAGLKFMEDYGDMTLHSIDLHCSPEDLEVAFCAIRRACDQHLRDDDLSVFVRIAVQGESTEFPARSIVDAIAALDDQVDQGSAPSNV